MPETGRSPLAGLSSLLAPLSGIARGFSAGSLGALLFERRCAFCAAPVPGALPAAKEPPGKRAAICPDCLALLPRRSFGFCLRCGEFTAHTEMLGGICGNCLRLPPPWKEIYFHGAYQGRLRELILRLKFAEGLHLAEGLGGLLAGHPRLAERQDSPEAYSVVVPVPLHASRLHERGFNQSALLAAPIAKKLGVKLCLGALRRTMPTGHQTGLTREQRRRNVAKAFACSADLRGRRVLLVDDVLTTGATLAAAAHTLLEAGAVGVNVAVVARTPARNMVGWG